MKKLDKLVLKSFFGPFLLTFVVVVFILLTQTMLKYFDDFVGKNLGFEVFAELIFYFSIFTTPVALPLAILLSSLMAYGNLGEHFELTAIKSSGISLLRTLLPIFVATLAIMVAAFFNNNYIVPKANLKAYSLLYDIKHKKPALDLKEGAFYSGIKGLSIKVNKKYSEEQLEEIIIYDHRDNSGNNNIILADSGRMYTMLGERYLVLELYDGQRYAEFETPSSRRRVSYNEIEPYQVDEFESSKLVLSLAEFDFKRTREELFETNRLMRNINQLNGDIDSLTREILDLKYYFYRTINRNLLASMEDKITVPPELARKKKIKDSLMLLEEEKLNVPAIDTDETFQSDSLTEAASDSLNKRLQDKDSLSSPALDNSEEIRKPLNPKELLKDFPPKEQQTKDKKISLKKAFRKDKELQELKKQDDVLQMRLGQIGQGAEQKDSLIKQTVYDSARIGRVMHKIDSAISEDYVKINIYTQAVNKARYIKSHVSAEATKIQGRIEDLKKFEIEKHKKFSQAFACLVMFLIGAPLGAIIKRGGLGIPVIISILFFIVYYVLTMTGEKWARQGVVDPFMGVWGANFILLPIGLFFLKQARVDARLFDSDFYNVVINKVRTRLGEKFKRKKN